MYIKKYEFRYGDVKDFYSVKQSAILDVLQDVSTKHSADKGYDMIKLSEIGIAWLLKGWRLKFLSPVSPYSDIEVHTTVRKPKAVTSDRIYNIFQNGELKIKATAVWFTFDINEQKACKIPAGLGELYMEEFVDDFENFVNPRECECNEVVEKILISQRDIDTNNHLNNQKSAEILMNALPVNFKFNTMTVQYKRAAYLGDTLTLEALKTENGYYAHLKNQHGEICVVGIFENLL